MGTSSSYTAPTSEGWPAAKGATTRFARQGGTGKGSMVPQRVLGAYVAALGGPRAAAGRAAAGQAAARRLGGFLSAVVDRGVPQALAELGFDRLIGLDSVEVLSGLVDLLAGPGRNLEEAAARAAMITVLSEAFGNGDVSTIEMFGEGLDAAAVAALLEKFLAEYIYRRMIEELGDRIQNGALTAEDAQRVEQDLHAFIQAEVGLVA